MRKTQQISDAGSERPEDVLVSVSPAVLHDAEHAVGNLLQRIHHTARVALGGAEAEHRERVRVALSDLERLLELLFDYVSPLEIEARPTEAAKVASSVVSQVRAHTVAEVDVVGNAQGKLMVDPRAVTRSLQLIGESMGSVWKEALSVAVEVASQQNGEGMEFAIRAANPAAAPLGTAARVALAVAGRMIELQGGELHLEANDLGSCRVVLPIHSGGRVDGI